MNVVLLFNSRAGSATLIEERLRALSRKSHVRVIALDSDAARNEIERSWDRWPEARWIVAGGDGTLHRLINQLHEISPDRLSNLELGIVPAGTGNDFARGIGAQLGDLDLLCRDDIESQVHAVDLMRVHHGTNERPNICLNSATGGVGGEIAERLEAGDKKMWGPFAYWVSVVASLADLHGYHLTLELVDESGAALHRQVDAYGVIVSNGQFIGGGFPIAPQAAIDDGLLDVTFIMARPGLELMAAGLVAAAGHTEHSSAIERYRAKQLRLHAEPPLPFSIDGEPTRTLDARFDVLPRALKVVVLHEAPGIRHTQLPSGPAELQE